MKKVLFALSFMLSIGLVAQERPRLMVGIVIDQMRWDYLNRFSERFGEGGFKRLLNNGFSCDNLMIDYIPTYTAIGHTSVWTGSVPSIHGIAGNDYLKDGKWTYCTEDTTVVGVDGSGKPTGFAGQQSPRNLLATTVGDELKLFSNFRSKVIGVALKDRASILPAGHAADGAYWFDDKTGRFITSTFYRKDLPEWVKKFNDERRIDQYLKGEWNTLFDLDTYKESQPDNSVYEGRYKGVKAPTFPYNLAQLKKDNGYGVIRSLPMGTTLTFDLAKAALEGEQLGLSDDHSDLLTVSVSTTDYIGHQFGTHAIELEDTYLRLDKDLEDFLNTLDAKVGKNNYIVFLTADHAAAHNISFLQDNKIGADAWNSRAERDLANQHLKQKFGVRQSLIRTLNNYQVFFYPDSITASGLTREAVREEAIRYFKNDPRYAYVIDMENIGRNSVPQTVLTRAINGYNRNRSGEIFLILQPGWYSNSAKKNITGTTHGAWNAYDAHIPCLFMGKNIPHGRSQKPQHMTDIAPTACALLGIQMPSGNVGNAISEIVDPFLNK